MRTRLEYILAGCLVFTITLSSILFVLLRENWGGYPPYTAKLLSLADAASKGSVGAAYEGWHLCEALPAERDRLDSYDISNDTIGICPNFKFLLIENSIHSGDLKNLRSVTEEISKSPFPGFKERIPFYKNLARPYMHEKCAEISREPSCSDKKDLIWLEEK